MLKKEIVDRVVRLDSATLHEASGQRGDLPSQIKWVAGAATMAGPALTVDCELGDNLWIHRAIYEAEPGVVLVVAVGHGAEYGYWGEILSRAAVARRLAGLVIDGCVRDLVKLNEIGFPVFARGVCMRGTGKDTNAIGNIGQDLKLGRTRIRSGDLVVGDPDGVVVLPQDRLSTILLKAEERIAFEDSLMSAIQGGATTLELLDLPNSRTAAESS